MSFFGCNLLNLNPFNNIPLKCVSTTNQGYKIRPQMTNISSNEPLFYLCSILVNEDGSCSSINDPCAKVCIPDVARNTNTKVFHLMSRTNETIHIKWHETCKCKCRLDASVCKKKCRCECKELIGKGICDKRFIWNLAIANVNVINYVMLENI